MDCNLKVNQVLSVYFGKNAQEKSLSVVCLLKEKSLDIFHSVI